MGSSRFPVGLAHVRAAEFSMADSQFPFPVPDESLALVGLSGEYAVAAAAAALHACWLIIDNTNAPYFPGEDDILPPITPYFVMKVGHVPLMPYRRPGDPATADAVAAGITQAAARGRPIRAAMLDRLGPLVWTDSPGSAMAVLEELEETARLWLTCQPRPEPLDDSRIDDLRRHSGAFW